MRDCLYVVPPKCKQIKYSETFPGCQGKWSSCKNLYSSYKGGKCDDLWDIDCTEISEDDLPKITKELEGCASRRRKFQINCVDKKCEDVGHWQAIEEIEQNATNCSRLEKALKTLKTDASKQVLRKKYRKMIIQEKDARREAYKRKRALHREARKKDRAQARKDIIEVRKQAKIRNIEDLRKYGRIAKKIFPQGIKNNWSPRIFMNRLAQRENAKLRIVEMRDHYNVILEMPSGLKYMSLGHNRTFAFGQLIKIIADIHWKTKIRYMKKLNKWLNSELRLFV